MNTRFGLLLGLAALGLALRYRDRRPQTIIPPGRRGCSSWTIIQAYNGSIGADSSLYGLKIAFENLDDSFTFNQSERLVKEAGHADLRLAELKGALAANRTDAADRALDQYLAEPEPDRRYTRTVQRRPAHARVRRDRIYAGAR